MTLRPEPNRTGDHEAEHEDQVGPVDTHTHMRERERDEKDISVAPEGVGMYSKDPSHARLRVILEQSPCPKIEPRNPNPDS